MRFGLLGPVEVWNEDGLVEIRGPLQRTLLAVLLLNANTAVSADRLADALWGESPPPTAVGSLHNLVLRLRRALAGQGVSRVLASAPGYLIRVGPGELDLDVFAEHCAQARCRAGEGRWVEASAGFSAALALWRGEPLADLPGLAGREPRLQHLAETRRQALEARIDADLRLSRHGELVGELRALTAGYPLHEAFHAQLMLALYRAGRPAEALDAFQALRRTLVADLGVEPSNPLQDLQCRILNADPGLTAGPLAGSIGAGVNAPAGLPASPPTGAHNQLPADTRAFTGRAAELERLLSLARERIDGMSTATMVVTAIDGMAGVGKSTLAVRAAHLLADRYPDGQLFLDLRGYAQGMAPREPADALAVLLTSLGVAPGQIPAEPDARATAYRERLAGTRTLILLDNASNEAQVRPLIPGHGGCLVLITSRKRLKALDDAHTVALDVLPLPDAVALLRRLVEPTRAPELDPGWQEIATLCGCLPLALRIVAALIRHRPAWTLGHLADKLRAAPLDLGSFTDGDRDLSAVFDLSYQTLTTDQRELLRRLGQVPGPDTDAYAAAALLGTDPARADRLLQDLVDHHVLTEPAADRYRMHDLIRAYAYTQATTLDPEPERDSALGRLLHYYAYTAQSASHAITRFPRPEPSGPAPAHMPDLRDPDTARAWLRAEQPNLDAAFAYAHTRHLDSHTVALATGLADILHTDGPWPHALELHHTAAEIARRLGQPAAQATALTDLGRVQQLTGDYAGADGAHARALEIYRALGDRDGEASALTDLGRVGYLTGDYAGAGDALTNALKIYRALGDRGGEAGSLTDLGRVRTMTGDYPEAGDALTKALKIHHALDDRSGEAGALTDLGRVRYLTGDYPEAVDAFTRALEKYRALDNRNGEAGALTDLGRVRQVTEEYPEADDALAKALEIYRALGNLSGEAGALTELGRVRTITGHYPEADDVLTRALEIYRETGERGNEAWALNYYAAVIATSDRSRALALYQQALDMNRELNKPDDEAISLEGIGDHHLALGDVPQATAHLRQALEIYQRLGMSADDQRVQARLKVLGSG